MYVFLHMHWLPDARTRDLETKTATDRAHRLHPAKNILPEISAQTGIGSTLRSDDAAGLIICEEIKKSAVEKVPRGKLKIFLGHSAPENLTGAIKRFNPTHLIIIDAADIKVKPGKAKLFMPAEAEGVTFCTHQLPLKILADYLKNSISCQIFIVGIQPKSLNFCKAPSACILKATHVLSGEILNSITYVLRHTRKS